MLQRLFWSREGEVNCKLHAPFEGSDTWASQGWCRMTRGEIKQFALQTGAPTQCEVCKLKKVAS